MRLRQRAPKLFRVLRYLLAALVGLQLGYLVLANALLRTEVIQDAIASSDGFHLELGRAYTLWPGRAYVEDLRLRVEDYNVQFELTLASAVVDIRLSELPFKKFHVTKLDAEGTGFRMRHKLITVGEDAERVAAYPKIAGFADPPYYVGVRPPPIPDAEYDLWEVRIENVTARVGELWILEHRFQGEGVARGSFVVKPARWVQVLPGELTLSSGTLRLGSHVVADSVRGRIECEVPDMDVQATEGSAVFREISSRLQLKLSGGKLDFLQAYLARLGSARYAGNADWHIDVKVDRGVVASGSRMALLAQPLVLKHEYASLTGDVMVSLARPTKAPTLALSVSAPDLRAGARPGSAATPTITGLRGSVLLKAADLTGPMGVGTAQLAIQNVQAPDLAWFDTTATKLAGSLAGELQLQRDESGAFSGQARVSASNARVSHGGLAASSQVQAKLHLAPSSASSLELRRLELDLSELSLSRGARRSQPISASLRTAGLRVTPRGQPAVRGALDLRLSSTEALLPLFASEVVRDVSSAALDLQALIGRADLELTPERLSLSGIDARSGRLRVRGHLEQRREPSGALLLSSGPLHFGVTLTNGNAELSPLVGDDWLTPPRS